MSFIRALSNPESLYIIGAGKGKIHIFDNGALRELPYHVFSGVLRKWHENGGALDAPVSYRGAQMTEHLTKKNGIQVALTYNGWAVIAYEVTWQYIACQFKWFRRGVRS